MLFSSLYLTSFVQALKHKFVADFGLSMYTKQSRDSVFAGCCLGTLCPFEGIERGQVCREDN